MLEMVGISIKYAVAGVGGDDGLQRRSSKAINNHDLLRFKRHDTGSP